MGSPTSNPCPTKGEREKSEVSTLLIVTDFFLFLSGTIELERGGSKGPEVVINILGSRFKMNTAKGEA